MAAEVIRSAQKQGFAGVFNSHPGEFSFSEDGDFLECAAVLGISQKESRDGGFVRVRSAALWIDKDVLAELPDATEFASVWVKFKSLEPERFRLFEYHDQAADFWFLRLAQWEGV